MKYLCIHGHFYQPPRENPWLGAVELQDSAYPYHDWNERITAECYAPNASSRILDDEKRIVDIVNNYSKISFNFGPTLLAWLETRAPETYEAILQADRDSLSSYSGHGSAIAQVYNHMIMPLATRRDKVTQVQWGIRDFQHRFRRNPEGMWLAETAVDIETLEVLAEHGIAFTILEPDQARRVRTLGAEEWIDVSGARLDPSRAYRVNLPSGRSIVTFFYDGPISRAVAFERLLSRGEDFAHRMIGGLSPSRDWPQLAHIATDGETYGHHHRHGDMALSYALDYIQSNDLARLTNYGEFLERHPPTHEVEIRENTSWSCAHGVERWRSDCGCHTGAQAGWNQAWRKPLRDSLDWLHDQITPRYEEAAREFLRDPWEARNRYIDLVLDRSDDALNAFLEEQGLRKIKDHELVRVLKLLEMQRNAMLMYTSCGWFFNDLSGIETVQVLHYAGRVIQLAEDLFRTPIEDEFVRLVEKAKSNLERVSDGGAIYRSVIKPTIVDLRRVGAHYAVASLFDIYAQQNQIYGHHIDRIDYEVFDSGRAKVTIGRALITSSITRETADLVFGTLYLGDVHLTGGLKAFQGDEAWDDMKQAIVAELNTTNFASIMRVLDEYLGPLDFSIQSLFRDEQRQVVAWISNSTLSEAEATLRQLHDRYVPLMHLHAELGIPIPKVLNVAAEFDLNLRIRRAFENDDFSIAQVEALFKQARTEKTVLDQTSLSYVLTRTLNNMVEKFVSHPEDLGELQALVEAIRFIRSLPIEVDLWKAQNEYFRMMKTVVSDFEVLSEGGRPFADTWLSDFRSLGETLSIHETSREGKEIAETRQLIP